MGHGRLVTNIACWSVDSCVTRVFYTAKSHLGWNVVGFMEAVPDLIKEVHGMDIEDLRGHEKRMMQHNRCRLFSCVGILNVCLMLRDLAAATRAKASPHD